MITDQHVAEDLSRAYVQAVGAKAGLIVTLQRSHDYGVDGTFHDVQVIGGRRCESGFALDFQLKASKNWTATDQEVVYSLEVKNYNDLVRRHARFRATPSLLVLLCLPENPDEWLQISERELLLRKCCYWERLKGDPSQNKERITVRIPRKQRLTPDVLMDLMNRVRTGTLK